MINKKIVAHTLGGEIFGGSILCPGPGHSSDDRSMSVKFDPEAPEGFVVQSFSGDDWRDCRDSVKTKLRIQSEWQPTQAYSKSLVGTKRNHPKDNRTATAQRIWKQSESIYGTPAANYLAGRNLAVPTDVNHALRFHPNCRFKNELAPAMIAAMVDIRTNDFRGIHRTRIDPKVKAMLGQAKDACVKLSPDETVCNGLAICEGIETGLALIAMGFQPLWACLSAGGIARFPVLTWIDSLTIFADNDASGTGQNSAIECGKRWQATDKEVRIFSTSEPGTDFADGMI